MDFEPRAIPVFEQLPDGREVLIAALIKACEPKQRITVSEWADQYRILPAEEAARPGPWNTDAVPHLRQVMDCLSVDHPARRVAFRGSAQIAKSQVIINWFGYITDVAPGSMLILLPSIEEQRKFSNLRLGPSIDASPRMREKVIDQVSRDEKASTTTLKKFGGGWAQLVTASSSKGLQSVPIRYVAMDEVSEYPLDTDGRGSPIDQARARQKTFGDLAKEFATSTPGVKGLCRITQLFEEGDQRQRYLPCPHCGDFQRLRHDRMRAGSPTTNLIPYFECISCGGIIEQHNRLGMFAAGEWVATSPNAGDQPPEVIPADQIHLWNDKPCEGRCLGLEPSFDLWSAYSTFESWSDIFARGLAAQKDPAKWKTYCQQDLGIPYEPLSDAPDVEALLNAREEWPQGVVPYPACYLTGFIDVQDGWFQWGVWAWGPGFQGYLVDRAIVAKDVKDDAAWALIDEITTRRFPAAGGGEVEVSAWGIDTGFQSQVLYDRVSKRPWLRACKGSNDPGHPTVKRSDATLKDKFNRPIPGRKIALRMIGQFDLKSTVYAGLYRLVAGRDDAGEWRDRTLHIPTWAGQDIIEQLTSELLIDRRVETKGKSKLAAMRSPKDMREWVVRPGVRNEDFDIVVGAMAMAWEDGCGSTSKSTWETLVSKVHRERPADFAPAPIVDRITGPAPKHEEPIPVQKPKQQTRPKGRLDSWSSRDRFSRWR